MMLVSFTAGLTQAVKVMTFLSTNSSSLAPPLSPWLHTELTVTSREPGGGAHSP